MSHLSFEVIKDDPIGYMVRINEFIYKMIKDRKCKRWHEHPIYVEITVNDPDGEQLVGKVCCKSYIDMFRGKLRYNVFYITIPYDTEFVIEGDFGRVYDEEE